MNRYDELIQKQKTFFQTKETYSYEFRLKQLKKLRELILKHEQDIIDALNKDLGKSEFEAVTTEIGMTLTEIGYFEKNLNRLMKTQKVKTNLINVGSRSFVMNEPYGNVLVLSPWNYPFQLAVLPIVGAIAGGNTVVLKPSEYSVHTSQLLKEMFSEFEDGYISVELGDIPETTELLEHKYNLIFFTGSPMVGSIVMASAAKQLTPVILELGGKSPCIIDKSAKLETAVKRVVFGKGINAGQTCVAPDYVMVHEDIKEEFYQLFKKYSDELFGYKQDFGTMINEKNFDRVASYIEDGTVICGGGVDRERLHIDLTLLEVDTLDVGVMKDEIFGPILPVMTFKDKEEVESLILHNPDPLAFYLFSEDQKFINYLTKYIPFGGGSINDTIMHLTNDHLPFGGRGTSGMGNYHGEHSFEAFTHQKAVLRNSTFADLPLRYPKVGKQLLKYVKKIMYK